MTLKIGEFTDVTLIYGNGMDGIAFRTEKKHIIARMDDEGGVYIPPSMVENHPTRLFLIQEEGGKIILTPIKLQLEVADETEVNTSIVTPPSSEEVAQVK